MLLLIAFAIGTLVSCWIWSDARVTTKCLITLLYVASWGALYIPFHSLYLFPLLQCGFILIVGGMTFGVDWLTHRHWP
jgi:hypothetical protein